MTCKNLPCVCIIPGHCRCTAGKPPCNRSNASSFCMSLRTSAHTGAAIRFPAGKLGKLALLRANPYALSRIRLRRCSLLCAAAGVTDCHVASLLAMTCKNLPCVCIIPGHCRCTAGKPPCNRSNASSFCMSLRTSAHTGVAIRFPAEMPGKLALLRANPQCFSYSPKVLLFVLRYRRSYGLPRRGAAAPLLAMTCSNLQRGCIARTQCHAEICYVPAYAGAVAASAPGLYRAGTAGDQPAGLSRRVPPP